MVHDPWYRSLNSQIHITVLGQCAGCPVKKGHCRQVEESYSAHPGMVRCKPEPGETAPHTIFHAGSKYSKLSNKELEIHGTNEHTVAPAPCDVRGCTNVSLSLERSGKELDSSNIGYVPSDVRNCVQLVQA